MRLTLPDIPRGMNGSNGLLRMGWRARSKYNHYWIQLVRSQIDMTHKTPRTRQTVFISQMRRKAMDRDNLYASCKPILDALVHWKLIKDDSEKYIELIPTQVIGKEKITIVNIATPTGVPQI
jgi:Holliday junction resolvase RusA-like endonuclease